MNPSLFVITPMLMSVQYDVVKDFTPISNFGTVPIAVGINPAIPAKTLQEFVAARQGHPGQVHLGRGRGRCGRAPDHETIRRDTRLQDSHRALQRHLTSPVYDLIAGHVSAMVSPVPNLIEQFRGGTVRPVAVATKATGEHAA